MAFDYEFWTKDINRRVQEVGGDGALVKLVLTDGRQYYVRRIEQTRLGTVSLSIYDPSAAKPIVSSTSEMHVLEPPTGTWSSFTVAFEVISDVQIRQAPTNSRLRMEI